MCVSPPFVSPRHPVPQHTLKLCSFNDPRPSNICSHPPLCFCIIDLTNLSGQIVRRDANLEPLPKVPGRYFTRAMSPQSASTHANTSVKSEASYRSPPSTLSDVSQHDAEGCRGRPQERDRSATAKAEDDSAEEKQYGPVGMDGIPRKRKRSRKGLEKSFACPHPECGKSYSRAEHLYRHQLNRE